MMPGRRLVVLLPWRQQYQNCCIWHRNARRLYTRDATRTFASNQAWSSQKIRETFIDFFKSRDHLFVPSSSVVPKKDEGSYFINAGMNQFKPLFLGTVDRQSDMASYRRVVNSQKCIRVGGKHNDLDDVGKDLYHHTFFEMLGNWSFGDYFKQEACAMAWDLLTNVYGLPERHLYVTYFGGNEETGLEPDLECRDIWLRIGVPPERVLPFGMRDNFWEMGETGPCGPCSELHYDHSHSGDARRLVNADHPLVIELWNIVFMQYDRLGDASLRPLPRNHVDTGMGLERVTAVLQGTVSNYNTDLFQPLFRHTHQTCGTTAYRGRIGIADQGGVDTAYHIVADHARMLTVAISDGLRPGRGGLDSKVRRIVHRCVKQAHKVLGAPPGFVGSLVPIVVESLSEAFPEIQRNSAQTRLIIDEEEQRYMQLVEESEKAVSKAIDKYGQVSCLTGQQILDLEIGRFGSHVPAHILSDLAEERGLGLDMRQYEKLVDSLKVTPSPEIVCNNMALSQHDIAYLKDSGIACTKDDYKYQYTREDDKYDFPPVEGTVLALKHDGKFVDSVERGDRCGVLVDETCFYAENGGQKSDKGFIVTSEGYTISIDEVQELQNYVLHIGQVQEFMVKVGDTVTLNIDESSRHRCMNNHTATHLLDFSLNCILGNVQQRGSMIAADKLTYDFSCPKSTVSQEDLVAIFETANRVIAERQAVYTKEVPLTEVCRIRGLHTVNDTVYPKSVRVISLGVPVDELLGNPKSELGLQHSVALCGGTHVDNTGHLEALVITNFVGMMQGTKRITAVTGDLAMTAIANGKRLSEQLDCLKQWTLTGREKALWVEEAQAIEKSLSGHDVLLSKIDRDDIGKALNSLQMNVLNAEKNKSVKDHLMQELDGLVESARGESAIVSEFKFVKARDLVAVLSAKNTDVALVLMAPPSDSGKRKIVQCIIYIPQNFSQRITAAEVGEHMCTAVTNGNHRPPKGKYAKSADIEIVTFTDDDSLQMMSAIHAVKSLLGLKVTP